LCLGVVLGGVSLRLQPPSRVDLFLYAHSTAPETAFLLEPLEASLRLSLRLRPAAQHVPLLDASLLISPLRVSLAEPQVRLHNYI